MTQGQNTANINVVGVSSRCLESMSDVSDKPPPEVEKPAFIRPLGPVDIEAMLSMVDRLGEKFWRREDEVKENAFFCFQHTRHIVFRFIENGGDARHFHSNLNWRFWRRILLPVMDQASAPYGYAERIYPKAMMARLAAGRGIDLHHDGHSSNLHTHKIHVPLRTNPGATVTVKDADFHLATGQAYEVNNIAAHGAFNRGDSDRIHFIFEVFDAASE